MRTAASRGNVAHRAIIGSASYPSPIGGWNAKDGYATMPSQDAIILDNWFPRTGDVVSRNGYEDHVTSISGAVETLMEYGGLTSNKLFAAANNSIYNVTSSGSVGAADLSGMTNDRWQHVNFGTSGGQFLVICNGADSVRNYDGTNWSTPSITGVTSSTLVHVMAHQRRLFFIQTGTLKVWYLGVASISGAASSFDLSPLCQLGGSLLALGTWTLDGGSGMDDVAVFITDKGEVVVYSGTDPSSANTWSLTGVFRIGKPIGRRCLVKYGSDLVVITEDGFIPLSKYLITSRAMPTSSVSEKISGAVNYATRSYGSNFGWQPIFYPRNNMLIFNVPYSELETSHQYVMNVTTRAWCRFTGIDAFCWALFNDELYFGGTNGVWKADTGEDDDGAAIETDVQTAYSYMRTPGTLKRFTMVRPVFNTGGTFGAAIEVNVDFEDRLPTATPTYSSGSQSLWDVSPWDTTPWTGGNSPRKNWQSVAGLGYAAALRMRINALGFVISWASLDWMYESGGYL